MIRSVIAAALIAVGLTPCATPTADCRTDMRQEQHLCPSAPLPDLATA